MTEREKMLEYLEAAARDPEVLAQSVLNPIHGDDLYRVWAFVESFRPEGELQRPPPPAFS